MARTIEDRYVLYHAGAIAASAAVTQLVFDAADEIVNLWDKWTLVDANDEVTIPEDGQYMIRMWANVTTGAGTTINFDVQANTVSVGDRDINLEGAADHMSTMLVVPLNLGDLVEFFVDPGAANMSITNLTIEFTRLSNL